jgi:1-acyl-sn-glycerol-3-phosphate acyltransferase
MGLTRHLLAAVRVVRALGHVLRGLWTIHRTFHRLTPDERQRQVQAWSLQMLQTMGMSLRTGGVPPANGPLLVVANHISWLDILVLNAVRPARFVSKADVKHWPLLGTLITGAGTLYIERTSRRDAMRVVHHMVEALREGDVLAVFPEGTTGDGRELLPFHANVLQAPIAAPAPVQAVALAYLDAATGQRSDAPTYIGDTTLLASLWRTFSSPPLVARVQWAEPGSSEGRDRRAWAQDLRTTIGVLAQNASTDTPQNTPRAPAPAAARRAV